MAKRKLPTSSSCSASSSSRFNVSCFDAALDVLATETFDKLRLLADKFRQASGLELSERATQGRWDEACKRHMVMKAMEDLCCASRELDGDNDMQASEDGRPLPPRLHPGAPVKHRLSAGEETEWRKWVPKVGDVVLVELANEQVWPGKIIERQQFFLGRSATRGNSFFPVRIYDAEKEAVISIKSRMIPFDLRSQPPLLASTGLLNAYNHARHPESFDRTAEHREKEAAKARVEAKHSDDENVRAQKAAWNEQVNWIMNERRVEKMRHVTEQRERQLVVEASKMVPATIDPESSESNRKRSCPDRQAGIFTVAAPVINPAIQRHTSSPQRPLSPRRSDKKRNGVFSGIGEYSPRGRGNTYTPPRILPSGDETAVSPTPAPSSKHFDFISPLGPPRHDLQLSDRTRSANMSRSSLEAVKEEVLEDDGEGDWHVVQRRSKRGDSAPCPQIQVE